VEQQERPERIRGQERFRRAQRLRSSMDFQRVRRRGRSTSGALLALGYGPKPNISPGVPGNESRVGFSISKRVGTAVVRNVIKRRLRESIRRQWSRLAPGWDIVITARTGAAGATYDELNVELCRLLERAHLLARDSARDTREPTAGENRMRDAPKAARELDRGSV